MISGLRLSQSLFLIGGADHNSESRSTGRSGRFQFIALSNVMSGNRETIMWACIICSPTLRSFGASDSCADITSWLVAAYSEMDVV